MLVTWLYQLLLWLTITTMGTLPDLLAVLTEDSGSWLHWVSLRARAIVVGSVTAVSGSVVGRVVIAACWRDHK